jgi:alanine racemase
MPSPRGTPSPRDGLIRHAANSAATIDLPQSHFDMVRPGIALYGYQPSDAMHRKLPLRPALRLVGRLMQTKTLPAGSACGYGLTHTFRRDSVVGLVPIGYGDGYLRCLSNRASVRVAGRDVPVCGRVSMDQIIVDLTDAPAARVGDEAEVISNDPSTPHSVENLARLAGTIPYEITCRLGRRVKRVLVD